MPRQFDSLAVTADTIIRRKELPAPQGSYFEIPEVVSLFIKDNLCTETVLEKQRLKSGSLYGDLKEYGNIVDFFGRGITPGCMVKNNALSGIYNPNLGKMTDNLRAKCLEIGYQEKYVKASELALTMGGRIVPLFWSKKRKGWVAAPTPNKIDENGNVEIGKDGKPVPNTDLKLPKFRIMYRVETISLGNDDLEIPCADVYMNDSSTPSFSARIQVVYDQQAKKPACTAESAMDIVAGRRQKLIEECISAPNLGGGGLRYSFRIGVDDQEGNQKFNFGKYRILGTFTEERSMKDNPSKKWTNNCVLINAGNGETGIVIPSKDKTVYTMASQVLGDVDAEEPQDDILDEFLGTAAESLYLIYAGREAKEVTNPNTKEKLTRWQEKIRVERLPDDETKKADYIQMTEEERLSFLDGNAAREKTDADREKLIMERLAKAGEGQEDIDPGFDVSDELDDELEDDDIDATATDDEAEADDTEIEGIDGDDDEDDVVPPTEDELEETTDVEDASDDLEANEYGDDLDEDELD